MAIQQNEYKRLPGRGSNTRGSFSIGGGNSKLYLGGDHLLRVNSNGWTENYRRFYFTDIQALTISLTSRRLIWNIVHAVLCALFLLWLLDVDNTPGRVTLAVIAFFFGMFFLINTLRGPTCRARIQTRIGEELLPSLGRLSKTRKVVDLIRPHIQAVQGELNPGEIPGKFAELGNQTASIVRRASLPGQNSYRGAVHTWLVSVLLMEVAAIAVNIFDPGLLAAFLILCTMPAVAVLAVAALVKQGDSHLGTGVKSITWISLAHVVLSFAAGYVMMIFVVIKNPKLGNNQMAIFKAMSTLIPLWIHEVYGCIAVFALVLAVAGLALLWSSQAAADSGAETSSQP